MEDLFTKVADAIIDWDQPFDFTLGLKIVVDPSLKEGEWNLCVPNSSHLQWNQVYFPED